MFINPLNHHAAQNSFINNNNNQNDFMLNHTSKNVHQEEDLGIFFLEKFNSYCFEYSPQKNRFVIF